MNSLSVARFHFPPNLSSY